MSDSKGFAKVVCTDERGNIVDGELSAGGFTIPEPFRVHVTDHGEAQFPDTCKYCRLERDEA